MNSSPVRQDRKAKLITFEWEIPGAEVHAVLTLVAPFTKQNDDVSSPAQNLGTAGAFDLRKQKAPSVRSCGSLISQKYFLDMFSVRNEFYPVELIIKHWT